MCYFPFNAIISLFLINLVLYLVESFVNLCMFSHTEKIEKLNLILISNT